jgi:hypothetical protein
MTTDSILLAILVVLILMLILAGLATAFLVGNMRGLRAEQQAMRRALANMDWTTVFSNMQSHAKESVRILDILDKRLQKLEVMEKILVSQTNPNLRS